jgi:hypothetical protein
LDLKTEIKKLIQDHLGDKVSPIFLVRILTLLEETPNDKEILLKVSDRINKMVSLFIDKNLGEEIYTQIKAILDNDV